MARTVRTGRGQEIAEIGPKHCVNGHNLTYPRVQVAWLPCSCQPGHRGHRTYRCWTCGSVIYDPEHDEPTVAGQGSAYG